LNAIARHVFYHTNIYWHSSTLLEEYSSLSNENTFLYDDNNDEYLEMNLSNNMNENDVDHDNARDNEPSKNPPSESSMHSLFTTSPFSKTMLFALSWMSHADFDDSSNSQNETVYYSYVPLRKNQTVLSTIMINSGKIHEFYKLSPFTRHTCVQILLNALCNPLLLPDDGTCCAQVPPLTRLQFLISLILGCSITFFIIYIVYRIRSVFILKRKRSSKLRYGKLLNHDEQWTLPYEWSIHEKYQWRRWW
jgi:hypothetical protein